MQSYLYYGHHDLVTPDGFIVKSSSVDPDQLEVEMRIENISPLFVGFDLPKEREKDGVGVRFNFRRTLSQLGLNAQASEIELDKKNGVAELKLKITAIGSLARELLPYIEAGAYIGKLFAVDDRRRVRDPDYIIRMFGRADRSGRPLLSLGGGHGSDQLSLETVDGKVVAFLALRDGKMEYAPTVSGFFPTLGEALKKNMPVRELINLHQVWKPAVSRVAQPDEMLLVCSSPLHIRTFFASVVSALLPEGYRQTAANILEPDTTASGDIYELFGNSQKEIYDIPLEFFTIEPHREYVFFSDRDQIQLCLEDPKKIFDAFKTAPEPKSHRTAVFVVKEKQMVRLTPQDWISGDSPMQPFPGVKHKNRQSQMVKRYIEQQPCYPFLKAIEDDLITSQGVLFTRYLPSPMMKQMLLSYYVQRNLMGLYFQIPSRSNGYYFSQEDRGLLTDLTTFGIPVYWADEMTGSLLQYVQRPGKTSGMFVPVHRVETFQQATFFGVYGSNLIEGDFENELKILLKGILEMRPRMNHPLLHSQTPLALVTGGGPGAMEVGNRMARELEILSCANIVDFTPRNGSVVNEQKINPYVEAKMTYRLDQLVERQAEFYLDFPIFVMGGIGTDFEYALEEVRHKVGARSQSPILLFGDPDYWREKITSRFKCNRKAGTISGSEWVSNSFFCVRNAKEGLKVYEDFFTGKLRLDKGGAIYDEGFVIVGEVLCA